MCYFIRISTVTFDLRNKEDGDFFMQVKKDDIKNNILVVAERLFIKRGYENTSLKMIAEKCNISKSNIYRYYSSKEEIYETIVGPAREEILKSAPYFFSQEIINKSVMDKCEEVPAILAGLSGRFHSEILIMLRAEGGKDRMMIENMITDSFVSTCPIGKTESKALISKMLMFGLTDILTNYTDDDSLSSELRALICYHYLGLSGLKERNRK